MKKDQDDRIAKFYDHVKETHGSLWNVYDKADRDGIIAEAISFGYNLGAKNGYSRATDMAIRILNESGGKK